MENNITKPTPVEQEPVEAIDNKPDGSVHAEPVQDDAVHAEPEQDVTVHAEPQADPAQEPEADDRHKDIDPCINTVNYKEKDEKRTVPLPTAKYETLMKLIDAIDVMSQNDFSNKYPGDRAAAAGINVQSLSSGVKDDILYDNINHNNYVNDVNYSDKEMNIRTIPIKSNGKLSGDAGVAKFTASLGIGSITQIPLWHSGISVTINPPKDDELINLEIALANNQIELGRETNTLIYSNYSVVFNRLVTDFIIDHIIGTTVKLDADSDLRDLIKVQDLPILVLGLINSIYPEGYNITRTCKNTLVLDNDGKPLCDYIAVGTVKPKRLLKVNRKSLTNKALLHMSKRSPNSTTIDEVKEYQLSISALEDEEVTLTGSNGTKINMTLSTPTLADYIDNGEAWIDNVISKTESIFTDSDSDEIKNNKVRDTLNAVILGIYNVYIKKITHSDGSTVEDRETIDRVLDSISSDSSILTGYLDYIKSYIDKTAIAIVATPNYTCPACAAKEQDADQAEIKKGAFKEFLPINVLEHFFDLSALRTSIVRERNIY